MDTALLFILSALTLGMAFFVGIIMYAVRTRGAVQRKGGFGDGFAPPTGDDGGTQNHPHHQHDASHSHQGHSGLESGSSHGRGGGFDGGMSHGSGGHH